MIDIEKINEQAPYKLTRSRSNMFWDFTTDFGVNYSVGFMPDDGLLDTEAYHFVIANINHAASPKDEKVRQTIMMVVDSFFAKNNKALLYICETGDGRQAMRSRLFGFWFSLYEKCNQFTYLSSSVVDEDCNVNYVSLIIRNDHPQLSDVVSQFTSTISAMNSKP